jgi:predicted nucleic acid-binding OB-fold protein
MLSQRPSLRRQDSRENVTYIIGRVGYEELTASARAELPLSLTK